MTISELATTHCTTELEEQNGDSDVGDAVVESQHEMEDSNTNSKLMLQIMDDIDRIYKDQIERLEGSSLKIDDKEYLQVRYNNLGNIFILNVVPIINKINL